MTDQEKINGLAMAIGRSAHEAMRGGFVSNDNEAKRKAVDLLTVDFDEDLKTGDIAAAIWRGFWNQTFIHMEMTDEPNASLFAFIIYTADAIGYEETDAGILFRNFMATWSADWIAETRRKVEEDWDQWYGDTYATKQG